mmetsp:Transcript_81476/g.174518  ORF Transcript_81476/g.174518 Transcript_81476/m.174518 type:complete len:693 (-) Transcript_81476:57-2135(-)
MVVADAPDLVIRGGTIVDGTGGAPFVADVAVTGGLISAVGPNLPSKGASEYDARGLVVAPGWVDGHTHFDGQVTWDPYLTPSSSGGVTTCIMGNCGVGFAPCQRERRNALVELVEAIEDVPGTAVHEGMRWEWETFEEYMDSISRKELACDVAVMIGHSAVRNWVLGAGMNRGDLPHGPENAPVRAQQIEAMRAVVRDAVAAGAMGFSTSRAIYHRDMKGVLMPGSLASSDEMLALLRAIGEGGGGVFGANLDFRTYDDVPGSEFSESKSRDHLEAEWTWLNTIASESPGKINMTFEAIEHNWDRFVRVEEMMERYGDRGLLVKTQCHVRPQGFLQAVHSRMNLLLLSGTYRKLRGAAERGGRERPSEYNEQMAALLAHLQDPKVRSVVIQEMTDRAEKTKDAMRNGRGDNFSGLVSTLLPFSKLFPWTPGCEPPPELSVAATAKREGKRSLEVYYDTLVPREGKDFGIAWKPLANYMQGDLDPTRSILAHKYAIPGVSDAGAHSGVFNDANGPTHLLTHWVRDRERGEKLPIELAVSKQTREVAEIFNLHDRGVLKPGLRADINVIDVEGLQMCKPFVANDLPTGATRWMQRVTGYRLTLVAGQATFRDGQPTGALPGRFVRNPKADKAAWRGVSASLAWREGTDGDALPDLTEDALKRAEGGGASSIARIARALESGGEKEADAAPKSRL